MKALDIFSGPGGLSLGLIAAGVNIIANVEYDKHAMATYQSHIGHDGNILADVREINFDKFRGEVDLVVGGPPCQPFSIGGLRKAESDARNMIPEFIRAVACIQPQAFLMENVPGLTFKRAKPYFDAVLEELARLGYYINWAVLNSADYGVPQKRRRLFIVGAKDKIIRFPAPTHGPDADEPHVTTTAAIGLEPFGDHPASPVKYARYPDLRPSPYAGHVYNGGGRPLHPDEPSHTILASSGGYKTHWRDTLNVAPEYHTHLKAGGKPRAGEVPGALRLSVEECAALQTFPALTAFSGARSTQFRQVGDAVPPLLAKALGISLRQQVEGVLLGQALLPPGPEAESMQLALGL